MPRERCKWGDMVPSTFSIDFLKAIIQSKDYFWQRVGPRMCNTSTCINASFQMTVLKKAGPTKKDKKRNKSGTKCGQNFGRWRYFRTQQVCTRLILINTQWTNTGAGVNGKWRATERMPRKSSIRYRSFSQLYMKLCFTEFQSPLPWWGTIGTTALYTGCSYAVLPPSLCVSLSSI